MPILEMKFEQKTLEDIFIELTKDYKAPVKKKRKLSKKTKVMEDMTKEDFYDEIEELKKLDKEDAPEGENKKEQEDK